MDRVLQRFRAGQLRPFDPADTAAASPWAAVNLNPFGPADDGPGGGARGPAGGGGPGGPGGPGGGGAGGGAGDGGAGGGGLAGWLNPSHLLAGAVDALYGDDDAAAAGRPGRVNWMQSGGGGGGGGGGGAGGADGRRAALLASGIDIDDPRRLQWDF